jgi:hypothetical protein
MTQVVQDQVTLAKLQEPKSMVEVRDEQGRIRGYFHPIVDRSEYQSVKVPFSDEELDHFEQEVGGRSLIEIHADRDRKL